MFKVLVFPFKTIVLFFKLSGVKGGILFGLGVLVGLLIAPQTGPELRARLQARLANGSSAGLPADPELTL